MNADSAAALRRGAQIAGFIANRVWIILVVSALGHLGAWHWFLDLFAHFRWQYLFASALCLASAIYAKKRYLMGLSVAVLLWNFALIAQYPLATPNPLPTGAKPLKVLFANCAMTTGGDALIALIHAESPDVIGIAELSDPFSERLKDELSAHYSAQALIPDPGWQGIGVLVKNGSLLNARADLVDPAQLEFPTARVRFQGGELLVVHPIPPIAADAAASRDAYFVALAEYAAQQPRSQIVIVTGDFNASVWSAPYRQMQISGDFIDSTVGFWPSPTWHGPSAIFAPLSIPIDQLILRGPVSVHARQVLNNPDSDHSVLITTLILAPL